MSNWKERYKALKNRGGTKARGLARDAKGSAIALVAGAAGFYGAEEASNHVDALRSRFWAAPAALAVAGHLVKSKNHDAGTAILGAAGALGVQAYLANKATAQQANGFADAGFLQNAAGDAGYLPFSALNDAGAYPALGVGQANAIGAGDAGLTTGDAGMIMNARGLSDT